MSDSYEALKTPRLVAFGLSSYGRFRLEVFTMCQKFVRRRNVSKRNLLSMIRDNLTNKYVRSTSGRRPPSEAFSKPRYDAERSNFSEAHDDK